MASVINLKYSGGSSSRVAIGPVEEHLPRLLGPDRRVIIITDANVHLHNRTLVDAYEHIVIGQGETNKTLKTVEYVAGKLLEMNADRSTFILGIGGGIVTDIAGFSASTYMRGVDFGFIPTTLLSQVDASVGGKNGVNTEGYKNIIGVFRQPEFVICDPAFLRTLSDRELRSGMAEVIKAGIIADAKLFRLLENHDLEDIKTDAALLEEIITRAIKVKAAIVQKDETEHGERRKLNLGHTFAHAMEKSMPTFSHGEAVAAGIVTAAEVSVKSGKLSPKNYLRIKNLILQYGLPAEYPVEPKKLLSAIKYDKKRERNDIYFVLPETIGTCEVVKMPLSEVEGFFEKPTDQRG